MTLTWFTYLREHRRRVGYLSLLLGMVSQQMTMVLGAGPEETTSAMPLIYSLEGGPVRTLTYDPALHGESSEKFASFIAANYNEPVVIKQSPIAAWTAFGKWTPEYLEGRIMDPLIAVKRTTDPHQRFQYCLETAPMLIMGMAKADPFDSFETRCYDRLPDPMLLSCFFRRVNVSPPDSEFLAEYDENDELEARVEGVKYHYYYSGSLSKWTDVLGDVSPLRPLVVQEAGTADEDVRFKPYVWIGVKGTSTNLHYDVLYNFNVQVMGQKHFLFFPPSASRQLFPYPFNHPGGRSSQLDVLSTHKPVVACPPSSSADAMGNGCVKGQEVTLEPGQALYIPPLWWHHVTTPTEFAVTVNVFSEYKSVQSLDILLDRGIFFAENLDIDINPWRHVVKVNGEEEEEEEEAEEEEGEDDMIVDFGQEDPDEEEVFLPARPGGEPLPEPAEKQRRQTVRLFLTAMLEKVFADQPKELLTSPAREPPRSSPVRYAYDDVRRFIDEELLQVRYKIVQANITYPVKVSRSEYERIADAKQEERLDVTPEGNVLYKVHRYCHSPTQLERVQADQLTSIQLLNGVESVARQFLFILEHGGEHIRNTLLLDYVEDIVSKTAGPAEIRQFLFDFVHC